MKANIKTIKYRGGVVSFEIPEHWKEEYEPIGGGTFYEDRPDSGTLRLNVLDFSSTTGRSSEIMMRQFDTDVSYEALKCGLGLKRYVKIVEENEELLSLHRWDIHVPVPPTGFRLVCFSYTILASQENDPKIKEELVLIEEIVRIARFSTAKGVAGGYYHETE